MTLDVSPRPCLFVDRDGILCQLVDYPSGWDSPQSPADVKLVPKIHHLILWANTSNLLVVEITNQPGVAKGKMSPHTAQAIENRVHELLAEKGARINHIYTCPHHPSGIIPELTGECNCRKPKPGLLQKAAEELIIDLPHSLFLGDKATDIQAGQAAGTHTALYLHTHDEPQKVTQASSATPSFANHSIPRICKYVQSYFVSSALNPTDLNRL